MIVVLSHLHSLKMFGEHHDHTSTHFVWVKSHKMNVRAIGDDCKKCLHMNFTCGLRFTNKSLAQCYWRHFQSKQNQGPECWDDAGTCRNIQGIATVHTRSIPVDVLLIDIFNRKKLFTNFL